MSGRLSIEKLETMTSVCSVGLDMIAIPDDTPATTISGMIADETAIGMVNHKTTAVRVVPVPGKGVGDEVSFGGLLGKDAIIPVTRGDAEKDQAVVRAVLILYAPKCQGKVVPLPDGRRF